MANRPVTVGEFTITHTEEGFRVQLGEELVAVFKKWEDAFMFVDIKSSGIVDVLLKWKYPVHGTFLDTERFYPGG